MERPKFVSSLWSIYLFVLKKSDWCVKASTSNQLEVQQEKLFLLISSSLHVTVLQNMLVHSTELVCNTSPPPSVDKHLIEVYKEV